jgi:HAE1 family hydrophobic/amphiphilic exporter-1
MPISKNVFHCFQYKFWSNEQEVCKIIGIPDAQKNGSLLWLFYVFWNYRFLFQITPSGFIPNEDRGIIFADVTLPPGSTLENTENTVKELDSIIESMDIVEARMNIVGFSLLNNINGGSYLSP